MKLVSIKDDLCEIDYIWSYYCDTILVIDNYETLINYIEENLFMLEEMTKVNLDENSET